MSGYGRIFLILLSWGAICFLLYLFVLSPSTKNDLQTKPNAQKDEPLKVVSSSTTSPPPLEQPQKDPFEFDFSESDIDEAREVVTKFLDVMYEGERTQREKFINLLKPYTTDSYLDRYRQSNGLGEALTIKEKHVHYIEAGRSAPPGTIGFQTVVITDDGDYFSNIYYLTRENGAWRIAEEEDGLVPEE